MTLPAVVDPVLLGEPMRASAAGDLFRDLRRPPVARRKGLRRRQARLIWSGATLTGTSPPSLVGGLDSPSVLLLLGIPLITIFISGARLGGSTHPLVGGVYIATLAPRSAGGLGLIDARRSPLRSRDPRRSPGRRQRCMRAARAPSTRALGEGRREGASRPRRPARRRPAHGSRPSGRARPRASSSPT